MPDSQNQMRTLGLLRRCLFSSVACADADRSMGEQFVRCFSAESSQFLLENDGVQTRKSSLHSVVPGSISCFVPCSVVRYRVLSTVANAND